MRWGRGMVGSYGEGGFMDVLIFAVVIVYDEFGCRRTARFFDFFEIYIERRVPSYIHDVYHNLCISKGSWKQGSR